MNVKNTLPEYENAKMRENVIQKTYIRMQHVIYQRKLSAQRQNRVKG